MEENAKKIKEGGVGIIPTDTLYGIVASALNQKSVERIYLLKERDQDKPFIVLINSIQDLAIFGVSLSDNEKEQVSNLWPGKVSIIFDCKDKKFKYLHRGKNSLAFRLPQKDDLNHFLNLTGPLVAPSANPQGLAPAKNISEAKKYFRGKVDFYIDGGELESLPSTIVKFNEGELEVLRKGTQEI